MNKVFFVLIILLSASFNNYAQNDTILKLFRTVDIANNRKLILQSNFDTQETLSRFVIGLK